MNRKKQNNDRKFVSSEFSIMLMTADGEWVNASHGGSWVFNFSLLMKEGKLKAGEYVVLVDPSWNEEASFHQDYKKVMVDLYAPCQTQLQRMSESEGLEVLTKTLKDVAVNMVDHEHREYPHAENEDYGDQVYRVTNIDASKCWYGFNYLRNDS